MMHWPDTLPPPDTSGFQYRRERAVRTDVQVESGYSYRRIRHTQTILEFTLRFDMSEDQVLEFFALLESDGLTYRMTLPSPTARGETSGTVIIPFFFHPIYLDDISVTFTSNPTVAAINHERYSVSITAECRLPIHTLSRPSGAISNDWIIGGWPPHPSPHNVFAGYPSNPSPHSIDPKVP